MRKLPEHIEAELQRLIDEGLPDDQIAFMLRLDRAIVVKAIDAASNRPPA